MKYLLIFWIHGQTHMQQFDSLAQCEQIKQIVIEQGTIRDKYESGRPMIIKTVDNARCIPLSK